MKRILTLGDLGELHELEIAGPYDLGSYGARDITPELQNVSCNSQECLQAHGAIANQMAASGIVVGGVLGAGVGLGGGLLLGWLINRRKDAR